MRDMQPIVRVDESHWYGAHPAQHHAMMQGAAKQARHTSVTQIVHGHRKDEPCTDVCVRVPGERPDEIEPVSIDHAPPAPEGYQWVSDGKRLHLVSLSEDEWWALQRDRLRQQEAATRGPERHNRTEGYGDGEPM